MNQSEITTIVIDVLNEAVEEADREVDVEINNETKLFGKGGLFDSLALVSFLVDVEDRLSEEFDIELHLSDEKALSAHSGPFRSVDSFVDYIMSVMNADEG